MGQVFDTMSERGRIFWPWLAAGVIVADQATKFAIEHGTREEYMRVLIPGLLNLVHRHNPGVAFGLLADSDSSWLKAGLVVFSLAVMVMLAWLLVTGRAGGARSRAGLSMILGGAAGNVVDRLIHGSVIDFVNLHVGQYHWPAFNVADSAIVVGAGLVILELLTERHHQGRLESSNV
jgi:signal peptidase II